MYNMNDNVRLNVLLLLDEKSQRRLETGLSELISHGIKVINSLDDITEEILEEYNKVIVLEDYVVKENSISNIRLFKEIFNLEFIYLGSDDLRLTEMSTVAECHKMDITNLNYAQIFGAVMKDTGLLERYKLEPGKLEDSTNKLKDELIKQGLFTDKVKELHDSMLTLISVLDDREKKIKYLNQHVQILERENLTSNEQSDITYKELVRVMQAESERDKSLLQYEVILSKDIYNKISVANFTKRPIIIYFKQYTKINNFNRFITTLYNCLRIHREMRCKVLKLYSSKDSIELLLQPKYMKVIRNSFRNSDIESNDFLCKYGDYSKVLEILLANKLEIDVLLVFDCKGNEDYIINGADLYFDICQNKSDVKALNLDQELTITNSEIGEPMSWSYDNRQLKQLDERDSLMYLSSLPVIQNILDNLDKVIDLEGYTEV